MCIRDRAMMTLGVATAKSASASLACASRVGMPPSARADVVCGEGVFISHSRARSCSYECVCDAL
eukprot:7090257-Prymnesium_polylepis.1